MREFYIQKMKHEQMALGEVAVLLRSITAAPWRGAAWQRPVRLITAPGRPSGRGDADPEEQTHHRRLMAKGLPKQIRDYVWKGRMQQERALVAEERRLRGTLPSVQKVGRLGLSLRATQGAIKLRLHETKKVPSGYMKNRTHGLQSEPRGEVRNSAGTERRQFGVAAGRRQHRPTIRRWGRLLTWWQMGE